MNWHHLCDPNSPELDELARRYGLHPLHIEDCRHRNQNAKVEEDGNYLFVVLKPVAMNADGSLDISDFDVFLGRDFVITVQEGDDPNVTSLCAALPRPQNGMAPDRFFHQIMDRMVDSYLPSIEGFKDTIDELEDQVLETPTPETLQKIFATKRCLIEMRRVLANMRDVSAHLQRTRDNWITPEMWPFFRDVYDHLARNLDTIDIQRDLLTGALDIYLSSVANRTNTVMKALTVLGTVALPALVISGFYGMNVQHLPWADSPHAVWVVFLAMTITTGGLLWILRRYGWF